MKLTRRSAMVLAAGSGLAARTPHAPAGQAVRPRQFVRFSHGGEAAYGELTGEFIAELTQLTRKYGVAIQSVGGVILADAPGEFSNVSYIADITSGDLLTEFPGL